jgi:hypothetical protein
MHTHMKVVEMNKLPATTPQPHKLQDTIHKLNWTPTGIIDFKDRATDAAIREALDITEEDIPFPIPMRKFVIVDGNHRIWVLQSLKVSSNADGERE